MQCVEETILNGVQTSTNLFLLASGSRLPDFDTRLLPSAKNATSYTLLDHSKDLQNVWWSHICSLTWPPWKDAISRLCPPFALLCQHWFWICLTGKTIFANNVLKLCRFSRDSLFICIHQYHPAVSVTPGTLNPGSWLVAFISKRVHYPLQLYVFIFF